jgi:hypothetical protein
VTTLNGALRAGSNALLAGLFPAREVFIRLSFVGVSGNLQVNTLGYEAVLAERL